MSALLPSSRSDRRRVIILHLSQPISISSSASKVDTNLHPSSRIGKHTSLFPRACSLFGILLTLWLAVLRLSSLGTCWKALWVKAFLLLTRPCSSALISYSRDLTNLSTSSSPCLKALLEVCVARWRASLALALWLLKRGRFAPFVLGVDEDGGSLRLLEG